MQKNFVETLGLRIVKNARIHYFHIDHNAPCLPSQFCITIVSNFSWVLQSSQEKSKTMGTKVLADKQGALWSMRKW